MDNNTVYILEQPDDEGELYNCGVYLSLEDAILAGTKLEKYSFSKYFVVDCWKIGKSNHECEYRYNMEGKLEHVSIL